MQNSSLLFLISAIAGFIGLGFGRFPLSCSARNTSLWFGQGSVLATAGFSLGVDAPPLELGLSNFGLQSYSYSTTWFLLSSYCPFPIYISSTLISSCALSMASVIVFASRRARDFAYR